MKFKVSTEDMFVKTAIIVEVKENLSKKSRNKGYGGGMASDYWDIIPKDPHEEESFVKPTRRILSHAQVAFLMIYHFIKLSFSSASPSLFFLDGFTFVQLLFIKRYLYSFLENMFLGFH